MAKVLGTKSQAQQNDMEAFAAFAGLDSISIEYADRGSPEGEFYILRKDGKELRLEIRGNKVNGPFLIVGYEGRRPDGLFKAIKLVFCGTCGEVFYDSKYEEGPTNKKDSCWRCNGQRSSSNSYMRLECPKCWADAETCVGGGLMCSQCNMLLALPE